LSSVLSIPTKNVIYDTINITHNIIRMTDLSDARFLQRKPHKKIKNNNNKQTNKEAANYN
jgi:hypothetical protein